MAPAVKLFQLSRALGCYIEDLLNGIIEFQKKHGDVLKTPSVKDGVPTSVCYIAGNHDMTLGKRVFDDIMKSFGMENDIILSENFQKETVSSDFYGTFAAKSGFYFVGADSIELWHLGNEDDFLVTADGRTLDGGFYNRAHLNGNDQYSVFLDGTHDVVTVTKKDGENRPFVYAGVALSV